MGVLRVCLFCVGGMIMALLLKQEKTEYGMLISLLICAVMMGLVLNRFSIVIEMIEELFMQIPNASDYIKVLLKMTGISYGAELAADLCKEAGYVGIAKQVQIFGRVSILMLGVPVISAFLEMVLQVLV